MADKIKLSLFRKFDNLDLLARQVVEGFITGMHKSPFHGFSVEFAEHRLYNPGESIRHIDWKLFARTEKLFVKKYEEETNLRCQIVLDNSSSMYFPQPGEQSDRLNKIAFSAYCAAAIIYMLRKQRDAMGLTIFSDDIETHIPAKSTSVHQKMLYTKLENILSPEKQHLNKKTNTAELLHIIAEKIHRRSLVIIFSDMMDNSENMNEIFPALQHLKHNKHEVVLFNVFDHDKEISLDYKNRPHRFIDMETGEQIKLNPNELRTKYEKLVKEYYHNIRLKCMQYRIDFVESDIKLGFDPVLTSFLVKRSKLY